MTKLALVFAFVFAFSAAADEQLLGYVRGSETQPKGTWEIYQFVTSRDDKGRGSYHALDTSTELEYGFSDRFGFGVALKMMSLNTNGLIVDGYLPKDNRFDLRPTGAELEAKYNFLSPAKDDIGLSVIWALENLWTDPHSGQDKNTYSFETLIAVQKYLFEGQLILMANAGLEATYAHRKEIPDLDDRKASGILPADFDWPAHPEMEIETKLGAGVSYRFIPNWFLGAEALYEVEYETEVGRERFSLFAGPSLHYGGPRWWATLTWFPQLDGGGEKYEDQADKDLHLIEKTKTETRLKVGFNF